MVSICHAAITAFSGFGYILGFLSLSQLETARLVSCAYLLYDFVQTYKNHDRQQYLQKQSEKTGKQWIAAAGTHSPIGVGFHHIVTVMFMFGFFFDGDITGTNIYFVGELPVLFVNIFWIYSYQGMTNTLSSMLVHNLAVWSYALIRIGLFAIVFLKVIIWNVSWLNPFAVIFMSFLVMVYVLNIIWFSVLLERNKQYSPFNCSMLDYLPSC